MQRINVKHQDKSQTLFIASGAFRYLSPTQFDAKAKKNMVKIIAGKFIDNYAVKKILLSAVTLTSNAQDRQTLRVFFSTAGDDNKPTEPRILQEIVISADENEKYSLENGYVCSPDKSPQDQKIIAAFARINAQVSELVFHQPNLPEIYDLNLEKQLYEDVVLREMTLLLQKDPKSKESASETAREILSTLKGKVHNQAIGDVLAETSNYINKTITENKAALESDNLPQFKRRLLEQFNTDLEDKEKSIDAAFTDTEFRDKVRQDPNAAAIHHYVNALIECDAVKRKVIAAIYLAAVDFYRKEVWKIKIPNLFEPAKAEFNKIFAGILAISDDFRLTPFNAVLENLAALDMVTLQARISAILNASYDSSKDGKAAFDAFHYLQNRLQQVNAENHYFEPPALERTGVRAKGVIKGLWEGVNHHFTFNPDTAQKFAALEKARTAFAALTTDSIKAVIDLTQEERVTLHIPQLMPLLEEVKSKRTIVEKNIENFGILLGLKADVEHQLSVLESGAKMLEARLHALTLASSSSITDHPAYPLLPPDIKILLANASEPAALNTPEYEKYYTDLYLEIKKLERIRKTINVNLVAANNSNAFDDPQMMVDRQRNLKDQLAELNKMQDGFNAVVKNEETYLQRQDNLRARVNNAITLIFALDNAESFDADYLATPAVDPAVNLRDNLLSARRRYDNAHKRFKALPTPDHLPNLEGNEFTGDVREYVTEHKDGYDAKYAAAKTGLQQHENNTNIVLICHTLANCIWNHDYWKDHIRPGDKTVTLSGNNAPTIPQEMDDMSRILLEGQYADWTSNPETAKRLFLALQHDADSFSGNENIEKFFAFIRDINADNPKDAYKALITPIIDFDKNILPKSSIIYQPDRFPNMKRSTFFERHPVLKKALIGAVVGLAIIAAAAIVAGAIYASGPIGAGIIGGAIAGAAGAVGGTAALWGILASGAAAFVAGTSIIGALKGKWNEYRNRQSQRAQQAARAPEEQPVLADEDRSPLNSPQPLRNAMQSGDNLPPNPQREGQVVIDPKVFKGALDRAFASQESVAQSKHALFTIRYNDQEANAQKHEFENEFVGSLCYSVLHALEPDDRTQAHHNLSAEINVVKKNIWEINMHDNQRDAGLAAFIEFMKHQYPNTCDDALIKHIIEETLKNYTKLNTDTFKGSPLDDDYHIATAIMDARKQNFGNF